ncbi:MAG: P-II family nitrogen regulator [Candidatus Thermoplasmatota archaeon]|nr:P-II family nitrogen regulator [Candidatus Thermoplasmatota archaeon]
MVEMHPMKKLEIVVDNAALDRVTEAIEAAGAQGYTILPEVAGKGHHGERSVSDDLYDTFRNAMIVVVAPPDVVAEIVERLQDLFGTYAGVLYTSDVQVARPEYF